MTIRAQLSGLGFLLLLATGLSAQDSTASMRARVETLRRSANQGNVLAEMFLGTSYEQGWTGKKNFKQALKWFRKAAAQGQPDAENSLGQMYEDGEGVRQSYEVAAQWYRIAAEHVPDFGGAGQGRNNLGLLYLQGRGVPQDFEQAYMWFALAQGEENLRKVRSKMNPRQILEAQQLTEEWKQQHHSP